MRTSFSGSRDGRGFPSNAPRPLPKGAAGAQGDHVL